LLVQRRLELQAHAGEDTFVNHLQRRHINQLALDGEQLGAVIDETETIIDVPTLLWQFSPLKDRAISGIHMPQLGSNLGDKDPASQALMKSSLGNRGVLLAHLQLQYPSASMHIETMDESTDLLHTAVALMKK